MTTLYLHIGASKCASSSIQKWLSANPEHQRQGKKLVYIALKEHRFFYGKDLLNHISPFSQYINAAQLTDKNFSRHMPEQVQKLYEYYGKETDFILSAENISARQEQVKRFIEECKKHDQTLKVKMLFIVRPQVEWINSGYFQWFAFEGCDFNDFSTIPQRNWFAMIQNLVDFNVVDELTVKPLYKDIMGDFWEWLGLDRAQKGDDWNNQSLGENLTKFIIHNQKALGRTIHAPNIDFMFEQFLSKVREINSKKAFTLTKEQIIHILDVHRADNKKMLQYFDPKDQEQILNNPKWWDVAAYEDMFSNPYNPTLELDNVNLIAVELTKLAQQLIVQKTQQQRSNTELQQQLKTKQEAVQNFQQQMVVKQKNLEELEQSLSHVQKSLENEQKAHHQEQVAKQNLEHKIQTSKKLSRINLLKALFSKKYRKSFIQYL